MSTRIRNLAAIGCLALCLCARADLPVFPESFERIGRPDESGTAWRESGEMAMSLSNAVETLSASFSEQGYALVHDIAPSDGDSARILFWSGSETNLLVMLQRLSDDRTGVRWGPTGKEGSGTAADSAASADGFTANADSGGECPGPSRLGSAVFRFRTMSCAMFFVLSLAVLVLVCLLRQKRGTGAGDDCVAGRSLCGNDPE